MFDDLKVRCRAGHKADETPVQFTLGGKKREVVEVRDRWYDPDADYFKVEADDGCLYLLRHERRTDRWTLRYVRTREPRAPHVGPSEGGEDGPH